MGNSFASSAPAAAPSAAVPFLRPRRGAVVLPAVLDLALACRLGAVGVAPPAWILDLRMFRGFLVRDTNVSPSSSESSSGDASASLALEGTSLSECSEPRLRFPALAVLSPRYLQYTASFLAYIKE
jgi:hypothetical protein